jgi:hypothetical protein
MTSGFKQHGIERLSPSSVNLFAMQPAAWIAEKLLGKTLGVGRAAHRGTASEAGVALGLSQHKHPDECVRAALAEYDRLVPMTFGEDKERDAVPGIVRAALDKLMQYPGVPETQRVVEWRCDDIDVPFIGYIDFWWGDYGTIIDLKTQLRLASEIRAGHARQVALYAAGERANADVRVAYATPRQCAVYELDDVRWHLNSLCRIAHTMGRFLALSADPAELARLTVPDLDHFVWNSSRARVVAHEIWEV